MPTKLFPAAMQSRGKGFLLLTNSGVRCGRDYRHLAGTIFKMTPSGVLTTLHDFCSQSGCGAEPILLPLLQATSGIFYGTTSKGGADKHGTVFGLSEGLSPLVTFVSGSGKVGSTVEVLGQGFETTRGVFFNGVGATFKIVSGTFLLATVPPGATTGYVTVTTPTGVLTSNVPFHVIP